MPRPGSPTGQPGEAELLRQFQAQLAGKDLAEMQTLLRRLGGVRALDRPAPSQRRERRADVVTYRVRVDLQETKPPLWRRLELASDMLLDELHEVLQAAFGWTDSHLHRFSASPNPYDPDAEQYLCPFDVEEGDEGIPEHEVRLDEVLVDTRDTLFYAYDFGDDWRHTVRLEAVLTRDDAAPRAVCTTGRRPGPPEDCGGVHGYELFAAAADATHRDHAEARAEVARMYGPDVMTEGLTPTPFDIDEINETLAGLGAQTVAHLPEPLADLVRAVPDRHEQNQLRALIDAAALDAPTAIDADTAARMVRPYTWLLDRVGDDGITLTGAGYLPPAHVEAAAAVLGTADEWIGTHNREAHTRPVRELRESAQRMGLLRKHRGKLLLTTRGRRLRTDPVQLWRHVAARVPPASSDHCETQAGLTLLLAVAAGATGDLDTVVARTLGAIGWVSDDDGPIDRGLAGRAARDTWTVLQRLGAVTGNAYRGNARPTPDGVTFARAALHTTL